MLLYKSDVGNYRYNVQGGALPHALQSVAGAVSASYGYDANGNMISASAGKYRSVGYTSFNLPDESAGIQGPAGGAKYTWQYDENHQRVKEVRTNASGTRTTWMLHPDNAGGLGFESETSPAGTSNRHYLSAGGQSVGVLVSTGALPDLQGALKPPTIFGIILVKLEYWHKDHLGSLIATTDHTGAVTARYAYDPFGKRRFTNGTYDAFGTLVVDWTSNTNAGTDRGYTGHEHLDDVGLVHMNGRIFDPTLGVFLQGDPFIQDPGNLQNFNRYGYCYNNPLTCTDPSGYFSLRRFVAGLVLNIFAPGLGSLIMANEIAHSKIGYQVGSIAVSVVSSVYCWWSGPAGVAACNAIGQAGWAAMAGYNAESSIKTGVFAGISSYANGLIHQGFGVNAETGFGGRLSNTLAHGAWGCMEGKMRGGDCGSGFRGGMAGAAWSNFGVGDAGGTDPTIGQRISNTMIHSVVGGLASVAGGGSFAQGAQSAAFAYLFNWLARRFSVNKQNYGAEVFDLSSDPDGTKTWGRIRRYLNRIDALVDIQEDVGCWKPAECYGTRDFRGTPDYESAVTMEPQINAMTTSILKENPSWISTLLTREQFTTFLDAFQGIKGFSKLFGTTAEILTRFPVKPIKGSTPAHGDDGTY